MKLKSVAARGTFLLSLLGTFGHPASALEIGAVGIDAPASESADVCQSAGPGVQICREVVNPVSVLRNKTGGNAFCFAVLGKQ